MKARGAAETNFSSYVASTTKAESHCRFGLDLDDIEAALAELDAIRARSEDRSSRAALETPQAEPSND